MYYVSYVIVINYDEVERSKLVILFILHKIVEYYPRESWNEIFQHVRNKNFFL